MKKELRKEQCIDILSARGYLLNTLLANENDDDDRNKMEFFALSYAIKALERLDKWKLQEAIEKHIEWCKKQPPKLSTTINAQLTGSSHQSSEATSWSIAEAVLNYILPIVLIPNDTSLSEELPYI